MFEAAPKILGREDDDVAAAATEILRDEGVVLVEGATVLAAAGRRPATEGLGLEAAGVRVTATGRNIRIAKQPVAEIIAMPRAYAVEETRGLMKFVLDADTDEILGAALLSVDAPELINTVALAMRHGIKAADLRESICTHPSSTEAFNDVLGTFV